MCSLSGCVCFFILTLFSWCSPGSPLILSWKAIGRFISIFFWLQGSYYAFSEMPACFGLPEFVRGFCWSRSGPFQTYCAPHWFGSSPRWVYGHGMYTIPFLFLRILVFTIIPSSVTFHLNTVEICKAYTKTILPFSSKWSAVLACLLLLICIAWYGFKHFKSFPGLLMCLLLVYTAGYAAMGGNLDVYEMDRYLSAVIPVIFFFLFFMLQDLLKGSKARGRILTTVVVLLWFSYPLLRTVNNTVAWHKRSCAQHIP